MKEAAILYQKMCPVTGLTAKVTFKNRPNGYNYRLYLKAAGDDVWQFYKGFETEEEAYGMFFLLTNNQGARGGN